MSVAGEPRADLPALTGIRGLAAWFVVLFHIRGAVATQLPPSQSVVASDAAVRTNLDSDAVHVSISNASVSNQVVIDREAASIVYQVIDNRTSQVVKQFPEEAVLRRRAYFHALDLTKEAPARVRATDRRA